MSSFLVRTIAEAERIAAEPWRAPSADGASSWTEAGRRPRQEELDAIRQAARDEGYAAGVEEGRAVGEADVTARARQLEEIVAAAVQPLADLDQALLDDLSILVLRATEHVVRHEARTDPQLVRDALELALEKMPGLDRELVVRVSPSDVDVVTAALAHTAVAQRAQVVASLALEPGGVELHSGPTRIDASIEARIAEVFAAVLEHDQAGASRQLAILDLEAPAAAHSG